MAADADLSDSVRHTRLETRQRHVKPFESFDELEYERRAREAHARVRDDEFFNSRELFDGLVCDETAHYRMLGRAREIELE